MPQKVAIIGAGISGIAAAVRLSSQGFHVDVFEKNAGPGGKMSELRREGFRFDTGPSLMTLPGSVEELFTLAGEQASEHFQYQRLEEVCRYFFKDGMQIRAFGEPDRFASELALKAGEDPGRVMDYLEKSRRIFEITDPVFISRSLHATSTYLNARFFKSLLRFPEIRAFSTLHSANRQFFRHPNTVNIFDRFATYNGSDPFRAPATLMVIPHLEHNLGAYFPDQGMHSIAASLTALATRNGASFHFNTPVVEVVISNNKVSGIRLASGEVSNYDIIISDADIWYFYSKLLKSRPFPVKWFRHERSTSALVFYWGVNRISPGLSLHNILFSADYREEFRCLFETKTITDDPTVYLFISSKAVPGDAPEGGENWFVMINTPSNAGQDWEMMIKQARTNILQKIHLYTGIDIEKHIIFEEMANPLTIEERTASYCGSLYGNSSNSKFAAFRRHPNFSGIKGLYFTGGSVHPGGGIPLCLSSAKIVSEHIQAKFQQYD